jgi:hypothetical protein
LTLPSARAGFTLIEALVAFIVLALLAIAVDRAVVASLGATSRADARLQSELVARMLLTGPLGQGPNAARPSSGLMNGHAWSIRFEPVNLPFGAAQPQAQSQSQSSLWIPVRMVVTVAGDHSNHGGLTVSAVRLVNMAAR